MRYTEYKEWQTPDWTHHIQIKSRSWHTPFTSMIQSTILQLSIAFPNPNPNTTLQRFNYRSLEIQSSDPKSDTVHILPIRILLFNGTSTGSESNLAQDWSSDSIFKLFAHLCIFRAMDWVSHVCDTFKLLETYGKQIGILF